MEIKSRCAVVLFDGVCNFCNGSVNFIIARDREDYFRFAPLQSELGQKLVREFGLDSKGIDSIIMIERDKAYTHSTAALKIARQLGGFWSLFYIFIIVPRFIRDMFYRLFARFRYTLFGKRETCMIPTAAARAKFLD
jgi:predicted DCC family thiol-disulfide oxidoreductase YuxK